MNEIVNFRKCTLTDKDLLEKVDEYTDKLFKGDKNILTRHIPARPNEDYDLLIGEIIYRFKEKLKEV